MKIYLNDRTCGLCGFFFLLDCCFRSSLGCVKWIEECMMMVVWVDVSYLGLIFMVVYIGHVVIVRCLCLIDTFVVSGGWLIVRYGSFGLFINILSYRFVLF